jgi:conjugative relaxase-like TrwC/TraI family protein
VAYVTPLYGGSTEQVDYRLGLRHGCSQDAQFSYHADARERPLRWIGRGLDAFGVEGLTAGAELTREQFDMARRLVAGQHPVTGTQLVTPKVAIPAAAKVALGPLVAAANEAAQARGVTAAELFAGDAARLRAWTRAEQAVARRGGRAVARVDEASVLAVGAGLDPDAVWGAARVGEARAALWEPRPVVGEGGLSVVGADGTPEVEMVERRQRVGTAGYDIGVTLPKSMSVLLGFAPDVMVGRIEDAYSRAAERTLAWTEDRTSYVKRGHHGRGQNARQERSSGFSGWVMTHRAARPVGEAVIGDPHWHVHITVANLAQAPDGTWLTIGAGGRELMRHAPAIDKVTQAQIRVELRRELGIEFARSERTGIWEVEHIPQATLDLFSKRNQQVTAVLAQLGYSNATASAKEARVLTRESRSGKSEMTAESDITLREYWRAQALAAGQDPAEWMARVLAGYQGGQREADVRANETMRAHHGITLDGLVAHLTGPESGLTSNARRFSHLDAITAVAEALPFGGSVEEVEAITDLVLAHPAFVELPAAGAVLGGAGERSQLAGAHQMAGGTLFTTRDVPEIERRILDITQGPARGVDRVVAAETLDMAASITEATQGYELSAEQRRILEAIVTSRRAVLAVEGAAGTGKTTLMRASRVAWEAQGFVVAGAATAAVAAQELAASSGIESRTVAQWLWRIDHGPGLAGIDKLVLDEANLTCDRDRVKLYDAAARAGADIVEIGDSKQLRGVGVGSMFGYLRAAMDGPGLTENRRQRSEDERAALAAYREGRFHEALDRWDRRGQIVATETSDQGVAAMVATWLRVAEGAPDGHTRADGLLMLAATNEQVNRINQATQAARAAEDQLGEACGFAAGSGRDVLFHVGDQVLIRRNDRARQAVTGDSVFNGYRGVVTAVGEDGVTVQWHQAGDPDGQLRSAVCSPDYIADGGLDLGYCLTTHKAEGVTVGGRWERPDGSTNQGTVLIWGPGLDNPGQYVAASRDRGQMLMFGALEELEGEREELQYGRPRDQVELTERVKAAFAQRAEATATSPNDRPVLADLGETPADPTLQREREQHDEQADQTAERRSGLEDTNTPDTEAVDAGTYPDGADPARIAGLGFTAPPPDSDTASGETEDELVTAAQREQWRELNQRYAEAWVARDPGTEQLLEQVNAYSDELGPERVEVLRREDREWFEATLVRLQAEHGDQPEQEQQRAAEREQRRAERERRREERRAEWERRPYSRRPTPELAGDIAAAERDRAMHVAAAERARQLLAERSAAVAAGQGRHAARVDAHLAELRQQLDLHRQTAELQQMHHSIDTQYRRTIWAAQAKAAEAGQVSRLRPGRRERLEKEAAELTHRSQQVGAQLAQVDAQLGRLYEQVGSPAPDRIRWDLERAEASYGTDRDAAQRVDQAELDQLDQAANSHGRHAEQAGARRDALAAEQELRANMPRNQRTAETVLRLQWQREQEEAARDRAAQQEREHEENLRRGYYDHPGHSQGHGHDDGMHLGY